MGARTGSGRASAPPTASTGSTRAGSATCIHNPATGRELTEPHEIEPSETPGVTVVVVGAGPGGLEAARVAAERGHKVVLFEAAAEAGGQVRLGTRLARRREMLGLIEWRVAECARLGVRMRFNAYAEAEDVLAEAPDIVVVATGGLPQNEVFADGADLAVSSWDVLSGDAKLAGQVLVMDDGGGHPGIVAAEVLAESGAEVELVTPERMVSPDVGGLSLVPYMRSFLRLGVTVTPMQRVVAVAREGNRLRVTLGSPYGGGVAGERLVDAVVVENGTAPLDDLYFALKEGSANRGEVDYEALVAGRAQPLAPNSERRYRLYRIGDAVASRNIHSAIYDALRLMKAL